MIPKKPIKGYIQKEKAPKPPLNLGGELFGASNLQAHLAIFKKNVESLLTTKTEEVDGVIKEVKETSKESVYKLDQKLIEFEKTATELIRDIHSIETIKGEDGKDADEDVVVENVLAKLPSKKELIDNLPKIDEEALVKRVIKKIPENKASLKIIQEKFETDPMSVIDKILKMPEGKFKLKTSHIDGLEQTISAFRSQITKQGYLHGGGDTVGAGANITITTNTDGVKIIASSGAGDVTGPSSSTDNAITRFSGTTGKIIQDYTSGAPTISDTGAMLIGQTLGVTGTITGASGTWDSGGMDIATSDTYAIDGTDVLTATTLGGAVVSASLT